MTSAPDITALQRRTVITLSVAQIFSALGSGAVLAVGNVMSKEITGLTTLSGLSTVAVFISGTIAAVPMANLAQRVGRRRALTTGLLLGCAGAGFMIVTPIIGLVGLLLGSFFLGFAQATNFQARFAATDLAPPERRARHLSIVVWTVTIGAVAGPNLIAPGAQFGAWLGLPKISGPFLFSLLGMVLALTVLQIGLRPDPLQTAQQLRRTDPSHPVLQELDEDGSVADPPNQDFPEVDALAKPSEKMGFFAKCLIVRSHPRAAQGIWGIWVGQIVMVAIMAMTPVHMAGDVGPDKAVESFPIIGLTISLHIAGMYGLSPVFGWMADHLGNRATMVIGQGILATSALLVFLFPGYHLVVLVALILLGLGWSACLVAGSAMLTSALPLQHRIMAQGLSDSGMSAMGALGAGLSGPVLAWLGFSGLGLVALLLLGIAMVHIHVVLARKQ